jgi:hypothetical protein
MSFLTNSFVKTNTDLGANIENSWLTNIVSVVEDLVIKQNLCDDAYDVLKDKIINNTLTVNESEFVRLMRSAGSWAVAGEYYLNATSRAFNTGMESTNSEATFLDNKRRKALQWVDMYLRSARLFAISKKLPYKVNANKSLAERTGFSFGNSCHNCK